MLACADWQPSSGVRLENLQSSTLSRRSFSVALLPRPLPHPPSKKFAPSLSAPQVQVGCHELLGHGSGKLFHRGPDGAFDFPAGSVQNPETGAAVASWYEAGQSWDTVFGAISSSYEECRAEAVGIFLAANEQVNAAHRIWIGNVLVGPRASVTSGLLGSQK